MIIRRSFRLFSLVTHRHSSISLRSCLKTYGTIRHRTKCSKGCLPCDGMLHMIFKLDLCAEKKWGRFRGLDYPSKVVTGINYPGAS
ncbi:MAG: hypothetical protein KZQ66_21215 [Candidatus Thiodiazotropha sp. (ex Lucinoma aequizonata)]|nr:hypothetical protein [Candidatus Thiodiazotropha sp. (ex Lucinoma aequizonata)]MCU7910976.1 hypothetical protein [Candidatus Thiodiazotropha sp. (ex Lucinoma aequizonata)]